MPNQDRPRHLVTVVALITKLDGTFLASQRKVKSGEGLYGCPGGSLELGESPERAVVREVYEETGIRLNPKVGKLRAVDIDSNSVMGQWLVIFYQFQVTGHFSVKNREPEKHCEWEWLRMQKPGVPLIPNLKRLLVDQWAMRP